MKEVLVVEIRKEEDEIGKGRGRLCGGDEIEVDGEENWVDVKVNLKVVEN